MKFQILNLIIWPKSKEIAPQILEFKPGVLNVITGISRTGKSAIIPIIDYCLASSDCFIPIDTIRDYASWYGIVIKTEMEEILLARKVPAGNIVSNEHFLLQSEKISIPTYIVSANENSEGIKNILNTISSVPYFSLNGIEDAKSYSSRLSFRDLMAFVFQNQDIVANQNILFYKTHQHIHREKLRNWFPYILGAETIETLIARQKLIEVEHTLKRLKNEYERIQNHSSKWLNNLLSHLRIAKEYGLLDEPITETSSQEDLLIAAQRILDNIPDNTKTDFSDIENAAKELQKYEAIEFELSSKIGTIKQRITTLQELEDVFGHYGDTIRKRVDRLHISQWLLDVSSDSDSCFACGSNVHPHSKSEINKISTAFKYYEDESKSLEEIPSSFLREKEKLESELRKLLQQLTENQEKYNISLAKDKEAQKAFQLRKNMFLFLGHLKASMETVQSLDDGGSYKSEIDSLQKEYENLIKKIDYKNIKSKIENISELIANKMLNHLKVLDVEEKYREIAPKFDITNLNIQVLSSDQNWHFLSEVGSASNWVSFHIALFCALQEFFISQSTSSIPSFVIFDQPSQVYFPKVNRINNEDEFDNSYESEDISAVKMIFNTISNSISNTNGAWQAIILDHADNSIYGEIEGIFEVQNWRNGKKLIPIEWYQE